MWMDGWMCILKYMYMYMNNGELESILGGKYFQPSILQPQGIYIYMYIYVCIYIYIYIYAEVYVSICVYGCMYVCVCVCIYVYIYVHTDTHTFTYIHTHIYSTVSGPITPVGVNGVRADSPDMVLNSREKKEVPSRPSLGKQAGMYICICIYLYVYIHTCIFICI
jgi:hypothetical protein